MNVLNKVFDKIYVITLERFNRKEMVDERLKDVDFEYFYGIDGTEIDIDKLVVEGWNRWDKANFGCSLSHLELYKKIKKSNHNKVLILEDDPLIIKDNLEKLEEIMLELPKNWDLLYLGLNNIHHNYDLLPKNYSSNLYKGVSYPFDTSGNVEDNKYSPRCGDFVFLEGTGAIAINNNFCDIMIDCQSNPKKFFTADGSIMYYGSKKINYFVCLPQIIIQDHNILSVAEKINNK